MFNRLETRLDYRIDRLETEMRDGFKELRHDLAEEFRAQRADVAARSGSTAPPRPWRIRKSALRASASGWRFDRLISTFRVRRRPPEDHRRRLIPVDQVPLLARHHRTTQCGLPDGNACRASIARLIRAQAAAPRRRPG